MSLLVELGFCDDTDMDSLPQRTQDHPLRLGLSGMGSYSAPYPWTDPLGIYLRLCDRLLEAEDAEQLGSVKAVRHAYVITQKAGSSGSRSSEDDKTKVVRVSASVHARMLDAELRLDAAQLVRLAEAVAKVGMGGHPVMNAVSNALEVELNQLIVSQSQTAKRVIQSGESSTTVLHWLDGLQPQQW